VVQSGTCALKVPAKSVEKPGEDAHPEQTVRALLAAAFSNDLDAQICLDMPR